MMFKLSILNKSHNRTHFDSGKESLNNYLKHQASQDIKKKLAVCFVLIDKADIVIGYYTLSNSSIPQKDIPIEFLRKFPKSYTSIPVTLLGRLAIDKSVLVDKDLENKFRTYHMEKANLRIVRKENNLGRSHQGRVKKQKKDLHIETV